CSAGTISPAAKARIWNLPSVISPTRLATSSAPPNRVSRLFGQLAARRHWRLGKPEVCCALACAAVIRPAPAAAPSPALLMNSRLFIAALLQLRNPADYSPRPKGSFQFPAMVMPSTRIDPVVRE